jgi:gamma-glutamylcyclotransferase (GGCT)/AIG2-like uncharacterized protein YtfP
MTLFTYGSLMFEPVWRRLVAHPCASMRAELPGFRRERVTGETYPGIVRDAAAQTTGRVYFGVNAEDLRRLDHFEGAAYQRTRVTVRFAAPSGAAVSIEVETYVFRDETALSGEPWAPEAFEREWAEGFFERHAAQTDAGAVKPPG